MSCEGNRHHFIVQLVNRTDLAQKLGVSPAMAMQFLERVYQTGRARGNLRSGTPEADVESALTGQLFDRMRVAGLKPPTHSPSGMPKLASRAGYGQMERVLQALEQGKPLPKMAEVVLKQMQQNAGIRGWRVIGGTGLDIHGYYRCANCGRFASQNGGHICPKTADAQALRRHLVRRLGVPVTAYEGYHTDPLGNLLEKARRQGTIAMIHALTGEVVDATLDGLPLAMQNGYIPLDWQDQAVLVGVTDRDGVVRILPVVNAEGMQRADRADRLVQELAQYYGVQIPAHAPIQQVDRVLQQGLRVLPVNGSRTVLQGGQVYDLEHFLGTEYRKASARGQFVDIGGKRYGIYARSQRAEDKSRARGRFATDVDNVVIGRTLPAAVAILAEGSVSRSPEGVVEVYDAAGRLISAYDPVTQRAGDVSGNPGASAEQMAAVLAARMLEPQNVFDYALIEDFGAFRQGNGSPIAAADSGYLALRQFLEKDGKMLHLGAQMGVRRCPQCGRFIGSREHDCPAWSTTEQSTAETPSRPVKPEMEPEEDTVSVLVSRPETVTSVVAPVQQMEIPVPAQIVPQQVVVQIALPDGFARSLGAAVAEALAERLPQRAEQPVGGWGEVNRILSQLNELLNEQSRMVEKLVPGAAFDGEAFGRVLGETLAEHISFFPSVTVRAPGKDGSRANPARRKCLKCGQIMGENHTCPPRQERQGIRRPDVPLTEVERILSGIELPAPDLYMDNVPEEWGGRRAVPLAENLPEFLPEYEMSDEARGIFKIIAMQLRKKSKKPTNRAFGIYGPAGTGKNTIARQLAACLRTDDGKQGLPYYEINVTPELDIQQSIGEVVLTTDENGNTVSQVRLGPVGIAAATGGVVAINEIVRSPKLATALQSMIEDGEISVPTPEGGAVKIPVHPSAIFVTTWNPGYEGDADRPAKAFLSRIMALPLPYPGKEAQIRRLKAYFGNQGMEPPSDEILEAAVNYFAELRVLTGDTGQTPQIGTMSPTNTAPGPRELARFVEIGTQMDWESALLTLEVICDQEPEAHAEQVSILRDRFEAHFGGLLS